MLDSLIKGARRIPTYANQVYYKDGTYIKIFDHAWEARKATLVYKVLDDIPVPRILKSGRNYIVMKEIKGKTLAKAKYDKKKIAAQLGTIIAKIHSRTYSKFGDLSGRGVGKSQEINAGPFEKWKEMHRAIVKNRLKYFKNTKFEHLIKPIQKYFRQNEHLIDYKITPRLLHIDLNKKNILVKNSRIVGILDAEGGFIGHNEEDLMRTELAQFGDVFVRKSKCRDLFFQAYKKLIPLDKGYEERRKFYWLSRAMVGMRCIIQFPDYNDPEFPEKVEDFLNQNVK